MHNEQSTAALYNINFKFPLIFCICLNWAFSRVIQSLLATYRNLTIVSHIAIYKHCGWHGGLTKA